jgi:outer membrane protein assembly factor BamB
MIRNLSLLSAVWLMASLGVWSEAMNVPKPAAPPPKAMAAMKADPKVPHRMFGGTPSRNMVNLTDKKLPVTWCVEEGKQKNIRWIANVGRHTYGGPVVADGKIFVGTNNGNPRDPNIKQKDKAILMAFNEADGKFLWQIVHDLPEFVPVIAREEGLCSTPVVENKRLYYVTPGSEVICADVAGKIVWSFDMHKELKVLPHYVSTCSPLIVGDLLMVVTGNGCDETGQTQNPKAASFIAVNKKTGNLVWQFNVPGEKISEGNFSSPTLAMVNGKPQVIFAGGDGVLYSFEPKTGALIWKCDCLPVRKAKNNRGINPHFMATPVAVGNRIYVGLGIVPETGQMLKTSYFLCLDAAKKGDVSLKNYDADSPANKDSALVWAFGGLIDPAPKKDRESRFGSTMSTASVHDGLVYIAEQQGYLHCLDAKTGQRYWQHDFLAGCWGSTYWADGKIYVVTDVGVAHIFLHGKERKYYYQGRPHVPTAEDDIKLQPGIAMDDYVNSTPVVANGVLYILTKSKLYAIKN